MNITANNSECIIASLCKEAERNRLRFSRLSDSANKTISKNLIKRIQQDMEEIQLRQNEIKRTAENMKKYRLKDLLSLELLYEIVNRPLYRIKDSSII